MRVLPARVHVITDYIIGILLLLAPNLFNFAYDNPAAVWTARIFGIIVLLEAVASRSSAGILHVLPMSTHIAMDYVAGILLALSPWLFGFANRPANVWVPHVIVGLIILGQALITIPGSAEEHTRADHLGSHLG